MHGSVTRHGGLPRGWERYSKPAECGIRFITGCDRTGSTVIGCECFNAISQIGLGVPILLLYEVSIILARMVEKKRAERDAAAAAGG